MFAEQWLPKLRRRSNCGSRRIGILCDVRPICREEGNLVVISRNADNSNNAFNVNNDGNVNNNNVNNNNGLRPANFSYKY